MGREPGLSEVILGHAELEETVHATRVQGLSLLTTGTLPPSPAELLGSPRMRSMITKLHGLYDMVVIDSPPVHVAADARVRLEQRDLVARVEAVRADQPGDAASDDRDLHRARSGRGAVRTCVTNHSSPPRKPNSSAQAMKNIRQRWRQRAASRSP